jgi:hypothetical protein
MTKIKRVRVTAFLPQLPSAYADQMAEGTGGTLGVAIKRAIDSLLKNPQVKNRRLQAIKLTIAVID